MQKKRDSMKQFFFAARRSSARAYTKSNPVVKYAWNESAQGGWLVPNM